MKEVSSRIENGLKKAVRPCPRIHYWAMVLLVVMIAFGITVPVQAHAMLVRSIPDANASLTNSPHQVELFFSEAIATQLSSIKVMDTNGKQINSLPAQVDAGDSAHLLVSLGTLGEGVYMVAWNVISAADGHQTSGSFPFAVGKIDPNALVMASSQMVPPTPPTPILDMIIKGFLFLAATALMGGILFTFLVWNPSYRKAQINAADLHPYETLSRRLTLGALGVLGTAAALSLMMQAGNASGSPVAWPWQPGFVALLGTRIGLLEISRLGLGLILAWLLLPRQNAWNRWASLGVCLVLLLTFSLESHAAGEPAPLLPVAADWIHMIAVSVWVGGLFSFLGGMWLIRRLDCGPCTRLTSILIPHFTLLAMTSVGLLTFTGLYASLLHIDSFASLLHTTYGQALILKLMIAAPMLAMGAINLLITTPSMRRAAAQPDGNPILVNRFRYLLTGEVALGVLALVWVGVFTTLPPAKMISPMMGYSKTTQVDDLSITLSINPGKPGINTFTASITTNGKPVSNVKNVSIEFASITGMVPASKAIMQDQGGGTYRLQGGYLGLPDRWDIKVVVIRQGKFDAYGDFPIDTHQSTGQSMP